MSNHIKNLPTPIAVKLRSIRTRQILLTLLRGVAISLAIFFICFVIAMSIDWLFTLFSVFIRVSLTTITFASVFIGFGYVVVPQLKKILKSTQAAVDADDAIPQLEERWTTVASCADSSQQPDSSTSVAMLEQVHSEALAMQRLVKPSNIVRPSSLKPAFVLLGGTLLLTAAFLSLNLSQTTVLVKRFFAPTQHITATNLVSTSKDIIIPRGEMLQIEAEASGLLRNSALFTVESEAGIVDVFELVADQDSPEKFRHEMRAEESFRYQFRAGDGTTIWHTVNVIDYPEIAEIELTIHPPEYLDRPAIEKTLIPSRVKVVQGSRMELKLKPMNHVKRLSLNFSHPNPEGESRSHELDLQVDHDGWYRFETQLISNFTFSPSLLNTHGLENEDHRICHIQVIEDMAPVARIVSPTDEMSVAADETVEIEFEAHDDHGIAKAELVIYDESNTEEGAEPEILEVREIPLGDQLMQKHLMGKTELNLQELNLREGTSISYSIRVSDNREFEIDQQSISMLPGTEDSETESSSSTSQPQSIGEENEQSEALAMIDPSLSEAVKDQQENNNSDQTLDSETISSQQESTNQLTNAKTSESGDSNTKNRTQPEESELQKDSQLSDETQSASLTENSLKENSSKNNHQSLPDPKPDLATAMINSDKSKIDIQRNDPQTGNDRENIEASQLNDHASIAEQKQQSKAPQDNKNSTSDKMQEDAPSLTSSDSTETSTELVDNSKTSKTLPVSKDIESSMASSGDTDPQTLASTNKKNPLDPDSNTQNINQPEIIDPSENDQITQSGTRLKTDNTRDDQSEIQPESISEPSDPQAIMASQNNPEESKDKGRSLSDPQQNRSPNSKPIRMTAQNSESNQNSETNRRRLKITERLTGVAEATMEERNISNIRDKVVAIDSMLEDVLAGIELLIQREIPDSDRARQYERLDGELGEVETFISELSQETEEGEYAFVGLQMVDIGRTHVTPARDRVFVAVRDPIISGSETTIAKGHVIRARELLAALLARYDKVTQDKKLAKSIEDSVEIYEVYVEKMQKLMRERRQNKNPLKRAMAVIEVDQEYLDRYAEVLTLRREMMREFGRMLSDDPRLLARYMDLIKRRNKSLRDQLSELAERQDEISYELSGWLAADEVQQEDVWTIVVETRLFATDQLAKDADELAERIVKQLPLTLEETDLLADPLVQTAKSIAEMARNISFGADDLLERDRDNLSSEPLDNAITLATHFEKLEAALDRLIFERDGDEEVEDYVNARLTECRSVADQALRWKHIVSAITKSKYNQLAELDQWQLNVSTELLRLEMLDFEDQIEGQFQQQAEADVPGEIVDMIRQMHRLMEAITFHQSSATFAARSEQLSRAEIQQAMALEKFELVEDLFDKVRRAVIAELDQYDVDDPNIANLQDPTLDEFLAQLEREPNIETQLGIPNRPRNLRVLAESMSWQQNGGGLGNSAEQARQRAQNAMQLAEAMNKKERKEKEKPENELTEEEKQQMKKAQQMQEMLEKSLASLEEQMKNPQTSPEEQERLERMKKNLQKMLREVGEQQSSAEEWERIVQRDQAEAILRAIAAGKPVPDEQWNKLLSTLEDGLWQVRGKRPPEEYLPAIEQYQDRLRELLSNVPAGAE